MHLLATLITLAQAAWAGKGIGYGDNVTSVMPGVFEKEIAYTPASLYNPYTGKLSPTANATSWIQIDLGSAHAIDRVDLYSLMQLKRVWPFISYGFPVRYKIETDNDPSFKDPVMLIDRSKEDQLNPFGTIVELEPDSGKRTKAGRHLRLTATVLGLSRHAKTYHLAMSKITVWSRGKDVALGREVTVDPELGNQGIAPQEGDYIFANHTSDSSLLTRRPRPMGEEIITDNPGNVIHPSRWRPRRLQATTPKTGVKLGDGVMRGAMVANIHYLLNDSMGSVEKLTHDFLKRAGKPTPDNLVYTPGYWTDFPGSNAARFLMGASNTLRWIENDELRSRVGQVIEIIADCAEKDGYIMAYPPEDIFIGERGGYSRSWVTQGLLAAGYTGFKGAFTLLRGYYDWFSKFPHLNRLMRGGAQGVQGMIANTLMARSPVGRPSDAQVVQRYFQENYWRDGLIEGDLEMIWQYPYDRPHTYLGTNIEAYADLYLLTGDERYLKMVLSYWNMIHDNWLHIGGATAIVEMHEYPPGSYKLDGHNGELCGNVFWMRINQRLHWLDPENEKYTAQIEKSIYNVVIANQLNTTGLAYHARLTGYKDLNEWRDSYGPNQNTCCEGQGTNALGSLAEYVFSTAKDGLYVNLFTSANITWQLDGRDAALEMHSHFPFDPHVRLVWTSADRPTKAKLRIRVPSWTKTIVQFSVNGKPAARGFPGTYVTLSRTWKKGDTIAFSVPAQYHLTKYTGEDQIPGHTRYGLEYGPILMAVVGPDQAHLNVTGAEPESLLKMLKPVKGKPLHSTIDGAPGYELMPYWEVQRQNFTSLPVIDVE